MPLSKAEQKKLFTLLGKQLSDAGPERQWAREDAGVPVKSKKRARQQSYDDQEESPIDQMPLLKKARAQQQQVQSFQVLFQMKNCLRQMLHETS